MSRMYIYGEKKISGCLGPGEVAGYEVIAKGYNGFLFVVMEIL